jgi:L,D-peptidoglycan transpeptidase YkuD (ErfK/YbiS/YcfS/YnhG family)
MVFLIAILFSVIEPKVTFVPAGLPDNTRQLILVESDDWTSPTGELQMLSKSTDGWHAVGAKIPVVLGRTGLAWGRGLQIDVDSGPQKYEGDGKAPAGVFRLGTAFGYAPQSPPEVRWPYRQAQDKDFFVDDPDSPNYNKWVTVESDASQPRPPWKSAEKMKRSDSLYEWGIVVEQNEMPVEKGRGSAIFFHVWRREGVPTAGCTAMSEENLLSLLRWLNPNDDPLVIQVPRTEINRVKMISTSP